MDLSHLQATFTEVKKMQQQQDVKVLQKHTSFFHYQDILTESKVGVLVNDTLPKIAVFFTTVILPFMLFNNLHALLLK